jgi:hypothetical protein
VTLVCGGGTSSARSGFGAWLYMAPAALGGFLNNIPTAWAVGLAGYIGLVSYELSTFCPNDPPELPTITAADVAALFTFLDPIGHTQAVNKFRDYVGHFLWPIVCQCDNGTVVSPGPPQAAPPGMPSIDPPAVIGPGIPSAPCVDWSFAATGLGTSAIVLVSRAPIPSGVVNQRWRVSHTDAVVSPVHSTMVFEVKYWNGSGTALTSQFHSPNTPAALTNWFTTALPAGAAEYQLEWHAPNANNCSVTWDYQLLCPGDNPGSPITPCCPPDQLLSGMVGQILELVTLIQRQAVPFAYVPGTLHNGLSGAGQLSVTGLIGAKVTITATTPGAVGVQTGDPEFLWQAGWINWGSADGWSPREFLSATSTVSLPASAGAYTLLGYSLPPGVTVSILELRREP